MKMHLGLLLLLLTLALVTTGSVDLSELSPDQRDEFANCVAGSDTWKKYGGCDASMYLQVRQRCLRLQACLRQQYSHVDMDISSCPFMDDMIMDIEQIDALISQHCHDTTKRRRRKRKIRRFRDMPVAKWPKNLTYSIDKRIQGREKTVIYQAIKMWQDGTCLTFKEVVNSPAANVTKPFLDFQYISFLGCYSYIGRMNSIVPQPIYLNQLMCFGTVGIVAHEIGHALGFFHEHQRRDRDKYVRINGGNIIKGRETYFTVIHSSFIENLGVEYDYTSDMHYNPTAFTRNGKETISTLDPWYQGSIGQRVELSFADLHLANKAYCSDECTHPLPQPCQHGGYQDPKDCTKCRCLDGWAGTFCTIPSAHKGDICGGVRQATKSWSVISSPNYFNSTNNQYKNGQECSWLLEAPRGSQIALKFVGDFGVYCQGGICNHWVEIRYTRMSRPGPRFCCQSTPHQIIRTQWEKAHIVFKAKLDVQHLRQRRGFQLHFAIDDNECDSNPCKNGGVCKDDYANYTCTCIDGWHGRNCEYTEAEVITNPPYHQIPSADIAIMIDSSSRVGKPWYALQDLAKIVLRSLEVGPQKSLAGIISFDRLAYVVAELSSLMSGDALADAVDLIAPGEPQANFFAPLWMLKNYLFTKSGGDRDQYSNIGIFITDSSVDFMEALARTGAEHVRSSGIKLFAIGVGSRVNEHKLSILTGGIENVFVFPTVEDIRSVPMMQHLYEKLQLAVYGPSTVTGASPTSTTPPTTVTTTVPPTTTVTTKATTLPSSTTFKSTTVVTTTAARPSSRNTTGTPKAPSTSVATRTTTTSRAFSTSTPATSTPPTTTTTTKAPTSTPLVRTQTAVLQTATNKGVDKPLLVTNSVKTTTVLNFIKSKASTMSTSSRTTSTTSIPTVKKTVPTTVFPELWPSTVTVTSGGEGPLYCAWKLTECSKPCGGCGKLFKSRMCFYKNGDIKTIFRFTQFCNFKTCKGVDQCWYYVGKFYKDTCKKCCDGYHQVGDMCEKGPTSNENIQG